MSQATLKRIEKTVKRLARDQEALRERLARLERSAAPPAPTTEQVVHFLDRFRAAEALGEASLGAWIAACRTDCLRGGLRTVQMREGSHARLLADRIKELGGTPAYEIPEEQQRAAMEDAASGEKSDAQKVAEFVARFPDAEAALRPIFELADRLDGDQETQFLLRTIAQDERSTLEFLCDACRLLQPEA